MSVPATAPAAVPVERTLHTAVRSAFTAIDPGPNPLAELRRRAGLSVRDLATVVGVDAVIIAKHEAGGYHRHIQPAVLRGLARVGADTEQIGREYSEWSERRASLLTAALAPRLATDRQAINRPKNGEGA